MAVQALTFEQVKLLNKTRPRKLRCWLFGHRLGLVLKPLPIRVRGGIQRYEISRCIRCGHTKLGDRH